MWQQAVFCCYQMSDCLWVDSNPRPPVLHLKISILQKYLDIVMSDATGSTILTTRHASLPFCYLGKVCYSPPPTAMAECSDH